MIFFITACLLPSMQYFMAMRYHRAKDKDPKYQWDERTVSATSNTVLFILLYVIVLPFLLMGHKDYVTRNIVTLAHLFDGAREAIWTLQTSIIQILLMLILRLMAVDMTFYQFIDWFLDIIHDDEFETDKQLRDA